MSSRQCLRAKDDIASISSLLYMCNYCQMIFKLDRAKEDCNEVWVSEGAFIIGTELL